MSNISRLTKWYEAQCLNEWHEEFGIRIETLDNPGWSLKIDLQKTGLSQRDFDESKIERTERDWVVVRKSGGMFEAFGGPANLDEMIGMFLAWAE